MSKPFAFFQPRALVVLPVLCATIAVASVAEAQGSCGGVVSAPYRNAPPGSDKTRTAANGNALEDLRARITAKCTPPSPDFVSADSKQLLAKIKLAKAQNDSSKALIKTFAARQKTIADQRRQLLLEERTKPDANATTMSEDEVRRAYLTPEMTELRNQLASSLRAILTPEQVSLFDKNVEAVKAKDAKTG